MANHSFVKSLKLHICFVGAAAYIAGCATSAPMTAANGHATPTSHAWQYLYAYGEEGMGYATYSYVLAGRSEDNPEVALRYQKLIAAIRDSTVGMGDLPSGLSREHLNIFVIPAVAKSGRTTPDGNYELAKTLLAALSTTSGKAFSNPGPYIITLYKPISFGEKNEVTDILYVDFTNIHTDAIREVVRTYKNRVVADDFDDIEKLKSLRLSLLNLALITEDCIGFAQTAYAEIQKPFAE